MKKGLIYIVLLLTCFYFLGAGNITFFSNLGGNVQSELCDLDKDADAEGKEAKEDGKEGKEDGCEEEAFLALLNSALLPVSNEISGSSFKDVSFFIPKHILEKSSPPPKA